VQPGLPPVDPGNPLLSEQPAIMVLGKVATPTGERMTLTIRTTSATLTVMLDGKAAQQWAAQLTRMADRMSAAGLVTGTAGPIRRHDHDS